MTLTEIIIFARLKGIIDVEEMSSSRLMNDLNLYQGRIFVPGKMAAFMYSVNLEGTAKLLRGRLTHMEKQPDGVQIKQWHEKLTLEHLEELI